MRGVSRKDGSAAAVIGALAALLIAAAALVSAMRHDAPNSPAELSNVAAESMQSPGTRESQLAAPAALPAAAETQLASPAATPSSTTMASATPPEKTQAEAIRESALPDPEVTEPEAMREFASPDREVTEEEAERLYTEWLRNLYFGKVNDLVTGADTPFWMNGTMVYKSADIRAMYQSIIADRKSTWYVTPTGDTEIRRVGEFRKAAVLGEKEQGLLAQLGVLDESYAVVGSARNSNSQPFVRYFVLFRCVRGEPRVAGWWTL